MDHDLGHRRGFPAGEPIETADPDVECLSAVGIGAASEAKRRGMDPLPPPAGGSVTRCAAVTTQPRNAAAAPQVW
ncbi:hypothetical protein [Amycolatopsis sp. CA-230715]|uniref:hypothetical protein n=1 Tax=Amycolatopsis sp. CA-230715 TaxID=2745196 RepID=UPI0020B1D0A9|nr:hypothetical protein [Amycolatopsis sp. CA-230715]